MSKVTYYWDEVTDNVSCEEDENGNFVASYQHQPGLYGELVSQERDGDVSYYHYDGQGNTLALANQNGEVTDTAAYTAYGKTVEQTGSIVNPFGYGGAVGYYTNTDTADIYIRARTYVPSLGRWSSRDPIGFGGQQANLYEYVGAKPLTSLDPSGLLSAKAVNPTAFCGGGSLTWDFAITGINEGLIVQKLCVSWSQVICKKKDDCCKGAERKACKKCFYERLRNFARDTVFSQDKWKTSFTPRVPNCGTRGTVRFTAEVKAFPYVLKANAYNHNWTPGEKIWPCPDFSLEVSDYSYQKPNFWDGGGEPASISSYMTATWKCCKGDGNQSQISYGTTGQERKVKLAE